MKNLIGVDPNQPQQWGNSFDALIHSKYAKPVGILAAMGLYLLVKEMQGPPKLKDSAHWATKAHLKRCRKLCNEQNLKGGNGNISLDLAKNLPIFDAVTSLITIGAPKTGKSYGATLAALYAHLKLKNPAILVDVQYPVQTSQVVSMARELGYDAKDIYIFAPGCPESEVWNICEHAKGTQASNLAKMLNENFATTGSGKGGDRFFDPAGEALISAVLQLARSVPGLDDIAGCQAILGLDELPKRVRANEDKISPWVYRAFMQLLSTEKSEKTAASIAGIAANLFKRFIEEDIAPALIGKSSFPMFLDGPKLLILGIRPDLREVVMPIQMALLSLLVDINSVTGRMNPLQVCFDELAAASFRTLPSRINENRKYGVYFNLAFQNLAQLVDKYGKELTTAILGACGTQILFNPREQETAKLISDIVGTERYRENQKSKSTSGGKTTTSVVKHIKDRPLIKPDRVRKMGQGHAIVLNAGYRSEKGEEEYIPYRLKIEVFEEYKKLTKWSESQWPHAKAVLTRRSPQKSVSPATLKEGVKLAHDYLYIPSKDDQKQEAFDRAMAEG